MLQLVLFLLGIILNVPKQRWVPLLVLSIFLGEVAISVLALIGQAVGEEARKEEVDAKKSL